MKKSIRIISLLLLAILSFNLFSCADNAEKKPAENGSVATTPWLDNLPEDLKFNDETVTFVTTAGGHNIRSILPDETSADTVDLAVFQRNARVSQRLGVNIDMIQTENNYRSSLIYSSVLTQLGAGSTDYDIIAGTALFDITLASKGYLLDINSLEKYNADYIDITQPYWNKNYIDEISYKDRIFWLTGDITLTYNSTMQVTFVNGDLYNKYLFAEYGSIYDIVRKNQWNLDLIQEMSAKMFIDQGSVQDKEDTQDILGFAYEQYIVDMLSYGCNVNASDRDADGNITIALNNSHTVGFARKMRELKDSKGIYVPEDPMASVEEAFTNGTTLFYIRSISFAETTLRDMDNFYIIPLPMLNSDQGKYCTRIGEMMALFGISKYSEKIPAAAATLEALAAESYRSVSTVYYDEALKYKYTRDDEAAEMIDLIRDSVYTDFVFAWGDSINEIWQFLRYNASKVSFSSTLKSTEGTWRQSLARLLNSLDEAATE